MTTLSPSDTPDAALGPGLGNPGIRVFEPAKNRVIPRVVQNVEKERFRPAREGSSSGFILE